MSLSIDNNTNSAIRSFFFAVNSDYKDIPISKLLAGMDENKNKFLSSSELASGILNLLKGGAVDKISSKIKSAFSSESAEQLNNDGNVLGMTTNEIKYQIDAAMGEIELDLNDIFTTISVLLGTDIKSLINKAKKLGIDLDITKMSISQVEKLLNEFDEFTESSSFAKNTVENGLSAIINYNQGNYLSAIKDATSAYVNGFILNVTNDKAADFTLKTTANAAKTIGDKVNNALGDNIISKAISNKVSNAALLVGYFTSGTAMNHAKREIKTVCNATADAAKYVWDWATDVF